MLSGLDGILLGGKAESIVPHGMQNLKSLEPLVPGIDIAGDVAERMADMQTGPRRIWKHIQHVILGLGRVYFRLEGLVFCPIGLPFLFYLLEIVIHMILLILMPFEAPRTILFEPELDVERHRGSYFLLAAVPVSSGDAEITRPLRRPEADRHREAPSHPGLYRIHR